MKALTLWQPWASLVANGAKPFEFRGWRAPSAIIGQRIAIHAGARKPTKDDLQYLQYHLWSGKDGEAASIGLHRHKAIPILAMALRRELPFSCIVCTAVLGEPINGLTAVESIGATLNDSDRDGTFNWGWPLTDIEPVPNIPARGRQGFWTWEEAA